MSGSRPVDAGVDAVVGAGAGGADAEHAAVRPATAIASARIPAFIAVVTAVLVGAGFGEVKDMGRA